MDRQDARTTPPGRKLSVSEAAVELGISAEAVRSRIKRGTLRSVKDGKTVYVVMPADQTRPDSDQTSPEHVRTSAQTADQAELVETLREQVAYLQGVIATRDRELEQRTEEIRRRDAALEREQQLTAMFATRLGELEAPTEPPGGPETAAQEPEASEPQPDATEAQTGAQRPWWRRFFGF